MDQFKLQDTLTELSKQITLTINELIKNKDPNTFNKGGFLNQEVFDLTQDLNKVGVKVKALITKVSGLKPKVNDPFSQLPNKAKDPSQPQQQSQSDQGTAPTIKGMFKKI